MYKLYGFEERKNALLPTVNDLLTHLKYGMLLGVTAATAFLSYEALVCGYDYVRGRWGSGIRPGLDPMVLTTEEEELLQEALLLPGEMGTSFADVGGLTEAKRLISQALLWPLQHAEAIRRRPLMSPTKGVLLHGREGTGKTLLCQSIAREAGIPIVNCRASSLTSKWFGESEKQVRAVFSVAKKLVGQFGHVIIFLDEIDVLFPSRGAWVSSSHASQRIQGEFLSLWDGIVKEDSEKIVVVACTNRIDMVDNAILRRFGLHCAIPLPNLQERKEILQIVLREEQGTEKLDLDQIAVWTDGFSGSDLANLGKAAAQAAFAESVEMGGHEIRPLAMADFKFALRGCVHAVSSRRRGAAAVLPGEPVD